MAEWVLVRQMLLLRGRDEHVAVDANDHGWAANAQNLYDRYEHATLISPHLHNLRMAGVYEHKRQLRRLLDQANSFKDPALPLPAY